MKKLKFTYKERQYVALISRRYTTLIKVHIFMERTPTWYRSRWGFIDSRMLCLNDYDSVEDLIKRLQEFTDAAIKEEERSRLIEDIWRSL